MNRLKINKKENNIIWKILRPYIGLWILVCCLILTFNIHPISKTTDNQKILYIFHDYEWNEYFLNEDIHGAANSMDYLFDDSIPEQVKWKESNNYTDSVSLWKKWNNNNDTKDNQVSFNDIISDLWIDSNWWENDDTLVISLEKDTSNSQNNEDSYSITQEDDSTLIIEKNNENWSIDINNSNAKDISNNEDNSNNDEEDKIAKKFSYITEWWILPILVPRDELSITEYNENMLAYNYNPAKEYKVQNVINNKNNKKSDWVTIIKDYADCMTPRWYKIVHWDSVLAYKQLDNSPDICNIERRYCRNGKLSWTYNQQWCSINPNYTYELKWNVAINQNDTEEIKWWARQNPDWTVTVKNEEIWWSFVFDRPNRSSTEFSYNDNIRDEEPWIEQIERPNRGCTAPWGEKVKDGQVIQAFKHANWFSDAPCETQFRLCSMWKLLWTYTQSSCKSWDTSFIDWVNGSPTRQTYSKEKLDLIKKQIQDEEKYYKNERKNEGKATDSVALDKILYILDKN